jgi:hypothetical protein
MTRLRLDIVDHVCDAAGRHGDDLWGRGDNAVWILDGATGLSAERLVAAGASDAAWFAAAIDEELRRADWAAPARDVLRDAATATEARFRREATRIPADESTWPAAAVTILRVADRAVELANLGDCKLLFRAASGHFATFGSSAVTALDRQLAALMVELQSQGVTDPADLWLRLVPVMQQGRRLRNTDGGYWVLDISGHGVAHAQDALLPAGDIREFLLVTDGFYRLVDTYRVYSDEQLLDAARSRGVAALCDQLRTIEAADERCSNYPRVKPRDDATAVLGRIIGQ